VSLDAKVNRGVAWAATAQAVIAIAELLSTLFAARYVGDTDYGIAALAFPFFTLLDSAADLGITAALIQRDDHTPERVSTVFWMNLAISGGLFALLFAIGPLYGWLQGHAIVGWLLVAYGGKLLFQNVYAIPFALLRKELRFGEIAVARTIAHLAESISRVIYAAAGATIWCWTLAPLTRAFVFGVIVQLRHPFVPRWVWRPAEVVPYLRFGVRAAASQVLYQLYTNLDYPIVGYFFGAEANGIYALAYFIVLEPVKMIANVVTDVAFPAFARLRDDRAALIDRFVRFTRLNLIAVLPFVLLVALVIPEFLHTFWSGGKWSTAQLDVTATAARVLCAVGVLRALGLLGPPLLDGIGRPELTLRYMIAAAVVVPGMFVAGALVLGDRLGLLSVAVAWAIGYPLAFAVLAYLVVVTVRLPLRDYLRAVWGIAGCCAGGLVAGLAASLAVADADDRLRMVVVAAAALGVTFGLLASWQKITPRSIGKSFSS
jgi:O-antigen/teichoic acid export membrane protein